MSRSRIVAAVATFAVVVIIVLSSVSCSSNLVVGASREPPAGDGYTGNASATVEPPEMDGNPPPPPPPAPEFDPDEVRVTGFRAHLHSRSPARADHLTAKTAAPEGTVESGAPIRPVAVENAPFGGLGAFVKPPDWEVENWYTLEFLAGENRAALQEAGEDRELTTERRIWMAQVMRVTLLPDPNFEVQVQSQAIQTIENVGSGLAASWQWKVKPHKGGNYTLYAQVEVLERGPDGQLIKGPDGRPKSQRYPARRVDVHVRVGTWRGFLNALGNASSLGDALGTLFRSWEKTFVALAALITALGGVWLAVKKLKRK